MPDVIVVGAGLAGLCCARELHAAGLEVLVLERGDAPGGRVRTDEVEGFLLDRGFQVLLTAYPEARRALDYDRLGLRPFESGALIRRDGGFARIADPFRHPFQALQSLRGAPGSLPDKLRVARLRRRLSRFSLNELLTAPQVTTAEALRLEGFSDALVDAFFRPFLGGVFLDASLETSSRLFAFVFKLFSEGEAALPAAGMQAIPRQLAEGLPEAALRFGVTVESAAPGEVVIAGGERLAAPAIVVAADGPEAARLTGAVEAPAARGVTTLHYAAERSPVGEPVLVLNGEGRGPVNDLCVPSDVAPSYAPPGAALVSATVLGVSPLPDAGPRRRRPRPVARLVRRPGGRLDTAPRPPHPVRAPGAATGRAGPARAAGPPARRPVRLRRPPGHGVDPGRDGLRPARRRRRARSRRRPRLLPLTPAVQAAAAAARSGLAEHHAEAHDGEHDRGDQHVAEVPLARERDDRAGHAHERRRDQHDQAQREIGGGVQVTQQRGQVRQRHDVRGHALPVEHRKDEPHGHERDRDGDAEPRTRLTMRSMGSMTCGAGEPCCAPPATSPPVVPAPGRSPFTRPPPAP